jgi:prolyl oligopeptidase
MKKHLLLISTLLFAGSYANGQLTPASKTIDYPQTRKVDTVTTYFGTKVVDPYRWLEDDQAADTKRWVQAESQVTQQYLATIPCRAAIHDRLTKLWDYERYSTPTKEGEYTYFYKNTGLQSQSVLYRQLGDASPEVFLDPGTFSKDGTTSLAGIEFTHDGSLAAYQLAESGSDWHKVVVVRTADKTVVGDTLQHVKFSTLAWQGTAGFYYSSYDRPTTGYRLTDKTQFHKLYYHQLGTAQSSDRLVFGGEQNPHRYISAHLTEDERFLAITASNTTTGNKLYVQDLTKPGSSILNVVATESSTTYIIGNVGKLLYIVTNLGVAPRYQVVATTIRNLEPENWTVLIASNQNVGNIKMAGGKLFAIHLAGATSRVEQYSLEGNLERTISLPQIGTVNGFSGRPSQKEIYYTFTSYTLPPTIFKYSISTGQSVLYKIPPIRFNPNKYESKLIFYRSKDGTRIPMVLTYKKGLVLDGKNPTLLHAYGGFGVNVTPQFSTSNIILLENGGIYAVPSLRGGGEYGENWHLAGTKLKKQTVFDDYIAAAEWLIQNRYTSADYLASSGASNGGLLVGATLTQRPDLFKVAFPAVGVLDMLRYQQFTSGAGWTSEYGTAQDSPEMFYYLYRYSPYHTLKPASYPATLITTADHDDRVVPAHSFKFAARLQETQLGAAPVLLRIETNAGHGLGRSTAQVISEQADKWAFLFENMGVKYPHME